MKKLSLLLLASIILTSLQAQNVDLSLRLEKDEDYKQSSNSTANVLMNLMGQEFNITRTVNATTHFLVKESNEEGYKIDAKYENLSMTMEMPEGQNVAINTMPVDAGTVNEQLEASNALLASLLDEMEGKTFQVTMNHKGEITDVENFDAIIEPIFEKLADELTEEQKKEIKEQIVQAYGDESLKSNMELMTAIYPSDPVKVGDKWHLDTDTESAVAMLVHVATEYELAELTAEYALIKGTGVVSTSNRENSNPIMAQMPFMFEFEGAIVSELKVDLNTGWIIGANINQEIEGEAAMPEAPEMSEGAPEEMLAQMFGQMKISMKMTSKTVVTN